MAKTCEVCGKAPVLGNKVTIRGKAKYLGGVGTKVTGISRRQFKPNLQRVRITTNKGTNTTVRVCTQCIRSGAITKRVRNAPFKLPAAAGSVRNGQTSGTKTSSAKGAGSYKGAS